MATSPGSRTPQVRTNSVERVAGARMGAAAVPEKQPRGTAATATATTQAARERTVPIQTNTALAWAAQREQVLLENMRLVRMVAYHMLERLPQHVELDDLVSAGVVGLIDAYNKFDPSKEVLFRSHAWCGYGEPSWTVCVGWIGHRGRYAARHAKRKKRRSA